MRFNILAVSDEEYQKANDDYGYAPKEHVAGSIEANTEYEAKDKLKRLIAKGDYPGGSQLGEQE